MAGRTLLHPGGKRQLAAGGRCRLGAAGDPCCCPQPYQQARSCITNALADVWMTIADAAIVLNQAFKFQGFCYYFAADMPSTNHGTVVSLANVTLFPGCVQCRGIGPCDICLNGLAPRTMLATIAGVRSCFTSCQPGVNIIWPLPNGSVQLQSVGTGNNSCPWSTGDFSVGQATICNNPPVQADATARLDFTKFGSWFGRLIMGVGPPFNIIGTLDFVDTGSFNDCLHGTFMGAANRSCPSFGTNTLAEGTLIVTPQ